MEPAAQTAARPAPQTARSAPRARQPFACGDAGFADFQLGSSALSDALALAESPAAMASALLLCRAAVVWFLSAQRARVAATPALPADRWAALQELPGVASALGRLPPEERLLAPRLLAVSCDEGELSSLTLRDLERGFAALRSIAFALGDPLQNDAAAARRRRAAGRARRAALFCLLALPLGWGLLKLLSGPNLALHHPITLQAASDPNYGVDPARAVDGDRTNLGLHTVARGSKSVTIDLLTEQRIRRVDVYNRLDCCLDRAVPLSIELSSDGQRFARVAYRDRRFAVWKARIFPRSARWVRLVPEGDQPFHLSEIEVY